MTDLSAPARTGDLRGAAGAGGEARGAGRGPHERLVAFHRAAAAAAPGARSLLLHGSRAATGSGGVASDLRVAAEQLPGTFLLVGCDNPNLVSFLPLRSLLEGLAPFLAAEAPHLLRRHAAEIAAVHPELARALPAARPAIPLANLTLTPSERRSHRESERVFRIVNGLSQLVVEAQQECATLALTPLVLWWESLDRADRPTLLVFRRLDHWANRSRACVLLIGTMATGYAGAPRPDHSEISKVSGPPELVDPALDWHIPHRALVAQLRRELLGEEVELTGPAGREGPASCTPAAQRAVEQGDRGATALAHLTAGRREEGIACALLAMRDAVFSLNIEAVVLLGGAVVAALPQGPETSLNGERLAQAWKEMTAGETDAAVEFVLGEPQRARDILIATWKAVALVHTFVEDHETALRCYRRALDLADSPAMTAQLRMYLGLITGKRLRRIDAALDHLDAGFAAIEGLTDPVAALERGWLLNVSALMAFSTGRRQEAMRMVKESFALMRPLVGSEATHLKINLISNVSVLLETLGQLDQAIRVWQVFERFLEGSNDVFAKHFFYRDAGLHLEAGRLDAALARYECSFACAQETGDEFHMEIAARGCAYVAYRSSSYAEAARWFARSFTLLERVGDHPALPVAASAEGLALARAGDLAGARERVELARTLGAELGIASPDDAAEEFLTTADPEALAAWEASVLAAPDTKLNRPFALIDLFSGPQRSAA